MTDDKIDVTKDEIIDNDLAPGVAPFESPLGTKDPSEEFAAKHDKAFDENMLNLPNNGIIQTSGDFIVGEAAVEGKSIADTIVNPIEAIAKIVEDPANTLSTLDQAAQEEGIDIVGDITPAPYAFLATIIGAPLWIWEKLTGKSPDKANLLAENPQLAKKDK